MLQGMCWASTFCVERNTTWGTKHSSFMGSQSFQQTGLYLLDNAPSLLRFHIRYVIWWLVDPRISQTQPDQAQYGGGGGYYGYPPQGYEAYGYAPPPQDPNAYYGGYAGGGYGNYQQPGGYQQQQQVTFFGFYLNIFEWKVSMFSVFLRDNWFFFTLFVYPNLQWSMMCKSWSSWSCRKL